MKIKSIKEIVNADSNKELVHIIGGVVTKKERDWSKKGKKLFFLVRSGNYCIKAKLDEESIKDYKTFVRQIKINKPIYLEGIIEKDKYGDTYTIDVQYVSSNIMLKELEHEDNKTLEIDFLMELYGCNEKKAVDIVKAHKELNVNVEYHSRIPIFTAISYKMSDLFSAILNHPKYNSNTNDGFGENILESLLYMYIGCTTTDDDRISLKKMIDIILNDDEYNFNFKDLTNDTSLTISCQHELLNWVTEKLLLKKSININIVNDFDCSALTEAIRFKNTEAIKMLSKMEGLVLRDIDIKEAKKANIDLSEYGITATATVSVAAE